LAKFQNIFLGPGLRFAAVDGSREMVENPAMKKIPGFRLLLWLLAVLAPVPALSQSAPPDDYTLIGAGIRTRPAYDGSASQTADLIPVLRYYGKPLFARTTQGMLEGGARAQVSQGVAVGVQLAYEQGRDRSESGFLRDRGVPDLHPGVSYGVHAEWDGKLGPAPINVLGRLRQNTDSDRGAQADLRLTAGVYESGGFQAGLFTQATWANRKSNRAFYGQPGFDPEGGLLYASVGALGSYDLARHWMLVGSVEARRLQGDAARSPLAERRSNYYASAGIAYRF
jgi:outer membrane scaffolding protein for murein synthesis (MipA/OmpV family)